MVLVVNFNLFFRWVRLSYVVASGYVLADTQDKASKKLKVKLYSDIDLKKEEAVCYCNLLLWSGSFRSPIHKITTSVD